MSAMARVVLIALLLVVASDVAKARKVSTKTTKLDAARFEVDDVFSPLQAELLKLAGLREVEYEFPNDAKMRSLARNASPEIAKVAGSASSENDRVGADNTLSLEEHKLTSALARLEKVARARELLGAGRHGSVERDLEDTRPSVGGDREPRSSRLGRCHEPGP